MQRRIPELEGLRAIAIGMVVLWHYGGMQLGSDTLVFSLLRLGRSGVDLFFVLSGFLITSILIETRGSPDYYSDFYMRRARRILPVYALMVAIYFVGRRNNWHPDLFGGSFSSWSYLVFAQNFEMAWRNTGGPSFLSATWSLAIEEHFYLLFPFVVARAPAHRLPAILVTIIVIAIVARNIAHATLGFFGSYTLMPCRADTLAVGALIAWAMQDEWARRWITERAASIRVICLVLIAGALLLPLIPRRQYFDAMAIWGYSYLALMYGAILLCVLVHLGHQRFAPLRARPARFMADISYALYLFETPVLFGLLAYLGGRTALNKWSLMAVAIAALAIAIALSTISLYVLERPIRRLGTKSTEGTLRAKPG